MRRTTLSRCGQNIEIEDNDDNLDALIIPNADTSGESDSDSEDASNNDEVEELYCHRLDEIPQTSCKIVGNYRHDQLKFEPDHVFS